MYPPHLPPPTCDLKRHQQWQRLKFIGVATLFGLVAGLSGAAVMLGWIWPGFNESECWLATRNPTIITRQQLLDRAEAKIVDKVFAIYQKATMVGKAQYFSPSDKVADAVMGVTSGWGVAYVPNFDGRTSGWVAVAGDGSLYSIDYALNDKRTGFVYFKMVPLSKKAGDEQFKVVTFNTDLKQYDQVFVYQNGQWLSSINIGDVPYISESHLDSVQPLAFSLTDSFANGSIAIDSRGNVIGFVVNHTMIQPLSAVDYFLGGIDSKKQILYPSLGIEGWYSEEKLLVLNEEKTAGFMVSKVLSNKQFFQKGDIILEVNGRPAEWNNLWYTISSNTVRLKVWRNGKTIEGVVSTIQL